MAVLVRQQYPKKLQSRVNISVEEEFSVCAHWWVCLHFTIVYPMLFTTQRSWKLLVICGKHVIKFQIKILASKENIQIQLTQKGCDTKDPEEHPQACVTHEIRT